MTYGTSLCTGTVIRFCSALWFHRRPPKTAMRCSKIERREPVGAVGAERQRFDAADGGKVQLAIKMREQRAAARRFPFQFVAELCRIDVHQHEVVLTGEMLGRGRSRLRGAGKMNEAVAQIYLRAAERTAALGFAPQRGGADFVDHWQPCDPLM